MTKSIQQIEIGIKYNPNNLSDLRKNFEEDPEAYQEEVFINLGKIANYVLAKSSESYFYNCFVHALEDYPDFHQNLTEFLYKKWWNVRLDATSKQIFNYMYSQVYYFVLESRRETQKRLKKEFQKTSTKQPVSESFDILIFQDPDLEKFAHAILERMDDMKKFRQLNTTDRLLIQKKLDITAQEFAILYNKLREYLVEENTHANT